MTVFFANLHILKIRWLFGQVFGSNWLVYFCQLTSTQSASLTHTFLLSDDARHHVTWLAVKTRVRRLFFRSSVFDSSRRMGRAWRIHNQEDNILSVVFWSRGVGWTPKLRTFAGLGLSKVSAQASRVLVPEALLRQFFQYTLLLYTDWYVRSQHSVSQISTASKILLEFPRSRLHSALSRVYLHLVLKGIWKG